MKIVEAFKQYNAITEKLASDRTHLRSDKTKLDPKQIDQEINDLAIKHLSSAKMHCADMVRYYESFGWLGRLVSLLNVFIGNVFAVSRTEKVAEEVRKIVGIDAANLPAIIRVGGIQKRTEEKKVVQEEKKAEEKPVEEIELTPLDQASKSLYDKINQMSLNELERDKFIQFFDGALASYHIEKNKIKMIETCTHSLQQIQDFYKPKNVLLNLNDDNEINDKFIEFLMKGEDIQLELPFKLELVRDDEKGNRILGIK